MKRWFQNFGEKLQTFMYGRYGYDELSRFLSICAIILVLFSSALPILSLVSLFLLIWSIVRAYSRNTEKRKEERYRYLCFTGKFKQFFKLRKNMLRDRKTHKYYKCPSCKAYLRVPKGKGKIQISCPKCKEKITKTT